MLKGKKFCGISERLLSKMSATAGTLARFGHDSRARFRTICGEQQLDVEPPNWEPCDSLHSSILSSFCRLARSAGGTRRVTGTKAMDSDAMNVKN
jgi:hypothetical protein